MSREIILLRHGRTPGNETHRYNGVTDEPLSDAGRAALSDRRFAFPDPEAVYVTRMRRTRETAAILFPNARQITVPGLREMDFGDFEGRNFAEMEHDAAYRAWVDSGCLSPIPNGEGRAVFCRASTGRSAPCWRRTSRSASPSSPTAAPSWRCARCTSARPGIISTGSPGTAAATACARRRRSRCPGWSS